MRRHSMAIVQAPFSIMTKEKGVVLSSGYFRISDVKSDLRKIKKGDERLVGRRCFYPIPPHLQNCSLVAKDTNGTEIH